MKSFERRELCHVSLQYVSAGKRKNAAVGKNVHCKLFISITQNRAHILFDIANVTAVASDREREKEVERELKIIGSLSRINRIELFILVILNPQMVSICKVVTAICRSAAENLLVDFWGF